MSVHELEYKRLLSELTFRNISSEGLVNAYQSENC
jgi:hypothetical protein